VLCVTAPAAPSRAATIALIVTTGVWALSNAISTYHLIKVLVAGPVYTRDGYPVFVALWMLGSLIAILSFVAALMALRVSRLGTLVLAAALLSPLIDVFTTCIWYYRALSDYEPDVGRLIRDTYLTSLTGEFGWRSTNGALTVWLVVPVLVAVIVWLSSRSRQAPAPAPSPSPSPGPLPDAWHVLANGQTYGPYPWHVLTAYASDGRVAPDAMIRRPDGAVVPLRDLLTPGV
jgi:hypothetical protein